MLNIMITVQIITIETLHFVEKGPERARGAHGGYKESIKEKTQQTCTSDLGMKMIDLTWQIRDVLTPPN